MIEKMIKEMIQRINRTIKSFYTLYEVTDVIDDIILERIRGQVDMLTIVTGKEYYMDAEGLHEREAA